MYVEMYFFKLYNINLSRKCTKKIFGEGMRGALYENWI